MTHCKYARRFLRALSSAFALILLAVLSITTGRAQDTIKIGYFNQIHDAAVMAMSKELSSKYKIKMIRFLRYTDAEVALTRGDLDAATLGYTNGIIASGREASPSFIFVSGLSRSGVSIVCRKGVKVDGWNDLKGKKFGVLTGGTAELFFDDALTTHGISRKDIPTISFTAPGPPLLQALKDKTIDCTAVYEPFAATAVAGGYGYYPNGVDLADDSFHGINSAWAVNKNFLARNRSFVKDAVAAIVKATNYYSAHKEKLQTDFSKLLEFKPNVIKIGTPKIVLDYNLYFESAMKTAVSMKRLGFIGNVPDRNKVLAYYDYNFLTAATGKTPDELGLKK